jgi:hypothetical protein
VEGSRLKKLELIDPKTKLMKRKIEYQQSIIENLRDEILQQKTLIKIIKGRSIYENTKTVIKRNREEKQLG